MYLLIISRIFDTIPVIDIGRSILISEGCIKNVVKFNCYKNIKKEMEKGKSKKKSLQEDIVFDNGIGVNQKRLKPCLEKSQIVCNWVFFSANIFCHCGLDIGENEEKLCRARRTITLRSQEENVPIWCFRFTV